MNLADTYYSMEHFDVDQAHDLIERSPEVVPRDGYQLQIHKPRLLTYTRKGTVCVACQREGTFYSADCHINDPNLQWWYWHPYTAPRPVAHLNLYGRTEDGGIFLMTSDHIMPRSLGGSDRLKNRQPMCSDCNSKKGNDVSWHVDLPRNCSGKLIQRPRKQTTGSKQAKGLRPEKYHVDSST